ncbi:MAG TPA: hypothetical protein VK031_04425 [Tissierellaceae bacterium]|nr:hypothetical protein [Tissierellaceae bacterium]
MRLINRKSFLITIVFLIISFALLLYKYLYVFTKDAEPPKRATYVKVEIEGSCI